MAPDQDPVGEDVRMEGVQEDPHDPDAELVLAKSPVVPAQPSQQTRDEHEASGHAQYRAWCRSCVAGKGRSQSHMAIEDESRELPMIGHDYTYLAEKKDVESGKASPILVGKCNKSHWVSAEVLPCKGTGNRHCLNMMAALWILVGYARLLSKIDQEPAIQDLRNKSSALAKADHGIQIVPEDSPTYESPSNGFTENACGAVKATVRVLKHAAEELHGIVIGHEHAILPFMVRYAAASMNRFHLGADGMTAWFRLKQKPYRRALPRFSEKSTLLAFRKAQVKTQGQIP